MKIYKHLLIKFKTTFNQVENLLIIHPNKNKAKINNQIQLKMFKFNKHYLKINKVLILQYNSHNKLKMLMLFNLLNLIKIVIK